MKETILKTMFKWIIILTIIRNLFNLINFMNGTITITKLITGCSIDFILVLITYIMLKQTNKI